MADPAPEREITIGAVADLHGELPQIGACDLLALVGDLVGPEVEHDDVASRAWLAGEFAAWLEEVPATEVIAIAGNHDFWAQDVPAGAHPGLFGARWTYLRDAGLITTSGLAVYGTPWTPDVYGSALEAPASELARIWSEIPQGLDLLLTHCPPHGHGDTLSLDPAGPRRMGAPALNAAITAAHPRLVLYGHAHEGHGYRAEDPAGTTLANVSLRTDYAGGLGAPSELRLAARPGATPGTTPGARPGTTPGATFVAPWP